MPPIDQSQGQKWENVHTKGGQTAGSRGLLKESEAIGMREASRGSVSPSWREVKVHLGAPVCVHGGGEPPFPLFSYHTSTAVPSGNRPRGRCSERTRMSGMLRNAARGHFYK